MNRSVRVSPLLVGISALFVACLVTANIVAVKLVTAGPFIVPAALVLFPLTYLFGDVLTEVWGYATARIVIWCGFFANAVAVAFIMIAVALPAAPFYTQQGEFTDVLAPSARLVAASFVAYLCGEFLNSFVLAKLKLFTNGRYLWTRTIGSTAIGQGVDSIIFITLAFTGTLPFAVVLTLIRNQWIIKVLYEVLATPFTYAIVTWLKHVEGVDTYDRQTSFAPVSLNWLRRASVQEAA